MNEEQRLFRNDQVRRMINFFFNITLPHLLTGNIGLPERNATITQRMGWAQSLVGMYEQAGIEDERDIVNGLNNVMSACRKISGQHNGGF